MFNMYLHEKREGEAFLRNSQELQKEQQDKSRKRKKNLCSNILPFQLVLLKNHKEYNC